MKSISLIFFVIFVSITLISCSSNGGITENSCKYLDDSDAPAWICGSEKINGNYRAVGTAKIKGNLNLADIKARAAGRINDCGNNINRS